MATTTKTTEERILAYVRKRKTPATVFDAMHAAGISSESSARNALLRLRKKGLVEVAGREHLQGYIGRPANLYRAA